MKNYAVVILNYNGVNFLEKFLPSVLEKSSGARVVVADNGSSDNSVEMLHREFAQRVEIIEFSQNYGFAGGYNNALSRLSESENPPEYYILLNSDVDVSEGWLLPIAEVFDREPLTAAIQPKILSFGRHTHFEYAGASGGFIDAMGYPFCRGRLINECEEDVGQYDDEREIFWASGAALAIRAEAYHLSGGLDALFFAHMEEIDMCWRLRRMGYSIKVVPSSVVFHIGAGTLPVWSPRKTYLNFRNNIAMLYKNLSRWRFSGVYFLRMGTDFLRAFSYLLTAKWKFAGAIFSAHYDFWRMRKKFDKYSDIPYRKVKQVYQGSIVLYYIFRSKKFKNIL
ncbi:MAG: glycosyltransferase family 2 protein [Rikenellaceae bacterium]